MNCRKSVTLGIFVILGLFTMLFGKNVYAQGDGEIHHRHTGNETEGGGCYVFYDETRQCGSYNVSVSETPYGTYGYYCRQCGARWTNPGYWPQAKCSNMVRVTGYRLNCGKEGLLLASFGIRADNSGWVREMDLHAEVTVHESEVSLSQTPYVWNGSASSQSSLHINANGTYTLSLQSSSENADTSQSVSISISNIDNQAPIIRYFEPSYEAGNRSAILSVDAQDSESGLASEAYSFDEGASWTGETTLRISANGIYHVWVKDGVGNVSKADVTVNGIVLPTPTPTNTPIPTAAPTKAPVETPTAAPTRTPTGAPTKTPTAMPTKAPSKTPTATPSQKPGRTPTGTPNGKSENATGNGNEETMSDSFTEPEEDSEYALLAAGIRRVQQHNREEGYLINEVIPYFQDYPYSEEVILTVVEPEAYYGENESEISSLEITKEVTSDQKAAIGSEAILAMVLVLVAVGGFCVLCLMRRIRIYGKDETGREIRLGSAYIRRNRKNKKCYVELPKSVIRKAKTNEMRLCLSRFGQNYCREDILFVCYKNIKKEVKKSASMEVRMASNT